VHFEAVSSRFEEVSRFAASELGYVLQIERPEGGASPATTRRSLPCCAPCWCSGVRMACGSWSAATQTRSALRDR
jgi:hypothetical protein